MAVLQAGVVVNPVVAEVAPKKPPADGLSSAQSLLATVAVADYPQAMALNSFTDRIYTIEESANQITEIDGVTNSATISLGATSPSLNGAIAVKPFTNTIYATDGVTNHPFNSGAVRSGPKPDLRGQWERQLPYHYRWKDQHISHYRQHRKWRE